jgi:photosystem II stability/assembly factor-like uncharacterized protein
VINKFVLSLTFLFVITSVQSEQAYQAPLVKESMLLDVIQSDITMVVGERGHILVGDAQGLTQAEVPTTVTLTAVDGMGSTYIAVGHDASILRTTDGGKSWTLVFSDIDIDRPFLDVIFIDEQEVVAVGGYGLFYRSKDAGVTWSSEQHVSLLSPSDIEYLESIKDDEAFYQEELNFIFPHFNRLSRGNNALYIAGEAGLVAKSNDRGLSWQRYEIDYFGSFFDTLELSTGALLAVGLRGNMFLLADDEEESHSLPTCATTSLNTIVNVDGRLFVLGNNGVVFSVDPSLLTSNELQPPNSEGCASHVSLRRIETDISSAISGAFMLNGNLTAVSANGLQSIELVK